VLSEVPTRNPKQTLQDASAQTLWQERSTLDEALVKTVHGLGASIFAWTVDNPGDMERLVRYGVDGICTNHPERARRSWTRPAPHERVLPRVAVIGAGTMGHGIAYVAAVAGCEVRLTDARRAALPQALDKIEALVVSGVKRGNWRRTSMRRSARGLVPSRSSPRLWPLPIS